MKFNGKNHSKWDDLFLLFILGFVRTSWAGRLTFINFIVTCTVQGCTRLDGARGKYQVWRLHSRNWGFRKYMYYIEESTCDIVETFRRPRSHWASLHWFGAPIVTRRRGIAPPFPPHYIPAVSWHFLRCCSYMRKAQVNFLTCKWLHDPWQRIQIQIKPKIALKISGFWVSFGQGKPATLATVETRALTHFLWITSVPQHQI